MSLNWLIDTVRKDEMKRFRTALLMSTLIALANGCSTPYMVDRGRDAADIFTATVGHGVGGAKARVGPFGTGLFHEFPLYGLRGGDFITPDKMVEDGKLPNGDVQLLLMGGDGFLGTVQNVQRGKSYEAMMRGGINFPRLSLFDEANMAKIQGCSETEVRSAKMAYLTQIEVAVGLKLSALPPITLIPPRERPVTVHSIPFTQQWRCARAPLTEVDTGRSL